MKKRKIRAITALKVNEVGTNQKPVYDFLLGVPSKELHTVFCDLIVSRILYALPAWGGFLTADMIGKIDVYLCKAIRWGYNRNLKMLSELFHDADMKLFRRTLHSTHCIHQFPIEIYANETPHFSLCFCTPICHYNLCKHSFVLRCIFDGANCLCCCLPAKLVAQHSWRNAVFGWRTDPVLRSACSRRVSQL